LTVYKSLAILLSIVKGSRLVGKPTDLVQGTVDLLILKTIALEPLHGWAIAQRIRQLSEDILQVQHWARLSGAIGLVLRKA
jgi:hypothetical protein